MWRVARLAHSAESAEGKGNTMLFTRPALQFPPYAMPSKGLYLCSSATPPGGGVHGMCGYFAARTALAQSF